MEMLDKITVASAKNLEVTTLYAPEEDAVGTIYCMYGLPGSGKSTLAREMVEAAKKKTVRFNKDDIRAMLVVKFSKTNERLVESISRESGIDALNKGFDIIIDDTNFATKHIDFWLITAMEKRYKLVKCFVNTPVTECVKRDAARDKKVGKIVIYTMNAKYLRKYEKVEDKYVVQNSALPKTIIVDVDGTCTVFTNHRGAFEYSKVSGDAPNMPIIRLVQMYIDAGIYPIFITGREDTGNCRVDTADWLLRMFPDATEITLHMRPKRDFRKDTEIKREIYDNHIKDKYNVQMVLEDRDSVVGLYRKDLKLPCLQVTYGDF